MTPPYLVVLHECTLDAGLLPKLIQDDGNAVAVLLLKDVLHQGGLQEGCDLEGQQQVVWVDGQQEGVWGSADVVTS